jgi:hypothetical protein
MQHLPHAVGVGENQRQRIRQIGNQAHALFSCCRLEGRRRASYQRHSFYLLNVQLMLRR